jgi:hypothetical protein
VADDLREQVARQYEAVAHFAKALSDVHADIAPMIRSGEFPELLIHQGCGSLRLIEILAEILNSIDAVSEEDEQFHSVILDAYRLFPPKTDACPHCGALPKRQRPAAAPNTGGQAT